MTDPRMARNEMGYRIGASHHNSTIPDAVIVQLRDLHERPLHPIGWRRLAAMFGLRPDTVKQIIYYKRCAQVPTTWQAKLDERGAP